MSRLLFITLILFSFNVSAEFKTYVVNSQHSSLNFSVPFMSVSKVHGTLPNFEASFKYDEKTNSYKDFVVKVSVNKLTTFDSRRDKHLLSKDFFFASRYPYFRFESESVQKDKNGEFTIKGKLTIRNVTRDFTVKAKSLGSKTDSHKFTSHFIEIDSVISRKKFGITWNKLLEGGGYLVGDLVEIHGQFESNPVGKIPQFSRFFTLKDGERRSQLKAESGVVLNAKEENVLLNKDLTRLNDRIEDLKLQLEQSKARESDLKQLSKSLKSELDELKARTPFTLWQQALLLLLGFGVFGGLMYFVIKTKLKIESQQSDTEGKKSIKHALIDGIWILGIFSLVYYVYQFVMGQS